MSVPSLTEKDRADIAVGVDVGVDYVALSFVRSEEDVLCLRALLKKLGRDLPIIAKIEKPEAVESIEKICAVADGVMVARGDLGVEVELEKVPVYQKTIIQVAHRTGKLCITATQMLDSMERHPRPTRAETTDVANAILDGTDAVMLSGETATGQFPLAAVRVMDRIAREVEGSRFFVPTKLDDLPPLDGVEGIVARAACFAASEKSRPLVIFTWSGKTALFASKARPRGPIFALTPDPAVADAMALVWGVTAVVIPPVTTTDDLIRAGEQTLLREGYVQPGEEIVILAGRAPRKGANNLMKIHRAGVED
jgi:pyruvate kinase